MEYQLTNAVWELTMKCNMRCQHCGSSCEDAMPDELTTEEALDLCDDLKELGLTYITLSGGELTTRADWDIIASKLVENEIVTSFITNGWLLNDEIIDKAKKSGINTIAISIDGLKDTHDKIRMPGSFERNIKNLKKIKEQKMIPAVITTVQKQNIEELEELYQCLKSLGVMTWQVQIALPMGNFKERKSEYLQPEEINKIINFAYSKIDEDMMIDLADCIGYYSKKDIALKRKRFGENSFWQGCNAGKHSIGILCNGDIVGCTSIRGKEFIEGNIREKKLKDIWNDEKSFLWNRSLTKESLEGNCRVCQYGDYCLGGCANVRYCMNGDVYSENIYCAYSLEINKYKEDINELTVKDKDELEALMYYMIEKKQYQMASIVVDRLKELGHNSERLQEVDGFIRFFQRDYIGSKVINEAILDKNPQNKYAKKGLGLAAYKIGNIEEGINYMYEALDKDYPDSYSDLYIVLKEQQLDDKAEELLRNAKKHKVVMQGI